MKPADLARRAPPAAWEAAFLIGVFPAGSALRWCKVHVFAGARDPARHALSALEGLDGPGEVLALLGAADRVRARARPLAAGEARFGDRGWDVRAPGLEWRGDWPALRLRLAGPELEADTRAGEGTLWWVRARRWLTYFTAFGSLSLRGEAGAAHGLGLVEHAWGAATRLDPSRLAPRRWHCDVLAFDGDGGHAAAGLGVGVAGRVLGVRGGGRLPGARFATGGARLATRRGLAVRVHEWTAADGRRVPARWTGRLRLATGEVVYEARAATPVAPQVPGGGFLGFDFEGELRPAGGGGRAVAGAGFCEYRAA